MIKNAHILLIEDDLNNIKILGKILSEEGFRVGTAQTGEQALKAVTAVIPDLILLDIIMPEMDGFEICQRIKELPAIKRVPIIFLTAKTEIDDVVKGFEVGGVDYLTKPFNINELIARVSTHLELKFSQELILKQQTNLKELVHILCHDLANPLQALVFSAQHLEILIKNNRSAAELMGVQKNLVSSAKRGSEIIQLVKHMELITDDNSHLKLSSVNLNDAFDTSHHILEHQFSNKHIEVVYDIPKNLCILAEKISLINSVINNLLTNAIKFSFPDSKIYVTAKQEGHRVILYIKDTGIGIPEELLQQIFAVNNSKTRAGTNQESGTGFGMYLIKSFITAYGGDIQIITKEKTKNSEEHWTEVQITFQSA